MEGKYGGTARRPMGVPLASVWVMMPASGEAGSGMDGIDWKLVSFDGCFNLKIGIYIYITEREMKVIFRFFLVE